MPGIFSTDHYRKSDWLKGMRKSPIISAFVVVVCFVLMRTAIAGSHGDDSANQLRPNAPGDAGPGEQVQRLMELKRNLTPTQRKISSPLRSVLSKINTRGITRANAYAMDVVAFSNPLVRLKMDGRIQVYVHLNSFGEAQLNALRSLELEIEIANEDLAIVQGWAPFDRIEEIASLQFVRKVTPPNYGFTQSGSVTTEGDTILNADQVRAQGFNGTGVKVGVISGGANNLSNAQASGDLPPTVTVFGSCTSLGPGSCNEGTAMLEIVHDIAPGAQLGFAALGNFVTDLLMFQAVDDLVINFDPDVLVDDIIFLRARYFEDGPIAQAVADFATQLVYVSAAGNSAREHYEANFNSCSICAGFHDFGLVAGGANDVFMAVEIQPSEKITVVLQWNDPFGGSGNDYDLGLTDITGSVLLESSVDIQDGNDNPLESLSFINTSFSPQIVNIVVLKTSGANKRIEFFAFGGTILEYGITDGSVVGHAAAIITLT